MSVKKPRKKILRAIISLLVFCVLTELLFLAFYHTPEKKIDTVNQDASKIFNACRSLSYREYCYATQFYKLTQKNPISHSIAVLNSLQEIDRGAIGCHFIAHKISRAETEKNPTAWEKTIKKININSCTGGFLHGVIEAHLETDPNFKIDSESAHVICDELIGDNTFGERSCRHIMGHLILYQSDGNENKAVSECLKMPLYMPQYECLSGAFMENLTRDYLVSHGIAKPLPWNLENSLKVEKLCNEFTGLPQKACWKEISYMYWSIYNTDPNKLFEACHRAPTEDMADECFLYGAGNMVTSPRLDENNLSKICSVYETGDKRYKSCTTQILGSLINTSTKNLSKTINMCLKIPSENQPFCFSSLIYILQMYKFDDSSIKNVCAKMPKTIVNALCTQAK